MLGALRRCWRIPLLLASFSMSDSEDSPEVPEVEYLLGLLDTLGLRDALRGGGAGLGW